jgi:glycine betaine/proline transport system permease protein
MAIASPLKNKDGSAKGELSNRQITGLATGALVVFTVFLVAVWGSNPTFPWNVGKDIGGAIDDAVRWLTRNGDFLFDFIDDNLKRLLIWLEDVFTWIPWPAFIAGVGLVSWRLVGRRPGIFAVVGLTGIAWVGLWPSAMETVALIVVAVGISILIAVPVGVLAAKNDLVDAILRPILDAMQTMPSFVYLVPAVMFFGIGNVPAIFATVIYAVPPAIRLTNLGIRQVSPDIIEAARSFGTTPRQLLLKVQIPMAIPTIMAGINQTVMMALAMVVIASLVGAGGLGEDVNRALNRQEPGKALLGGLGIVILAIIIDRITQAAAKSRQEALTGSKI